LHQPIDGARHCQQTRSQDINPIKIEKYKQKVGAPFDSPRGELEGEPCGAKRMADRGEGSALISAEAFDPERARLSKSSE